LLPQGKACRQLQDNARQVHESLLLPQSNGWQVYESLYREAIHCEKSLFDLASCQKIPALRTEIPAVDTRTICLLPIEFF
jgi:hypothetical protein